MELEVTEREQKYINTLKELREENFSKNLPYLMLSDQLPEGQAYREYADGHIELQEILVNGSDYHFKVIKTLSPSEAARVRKEYGLF